MTPRRVHVQEAVGHGRIGTHAGALNEQLRHPPETAESRVDLARLEELLHHAPGVGLKDLRTGQSRDDVAAQIACGQRRQQDEPCPACSSAPSSSADSASRAINGLSHQRSRNCRPDSLMASGHAAFVLVWMAMTFASLARSSTASACASICGKDSGPAGTGHLLLPGFSSRHEIDSRRSVSLVEFGVQIVEQGQRLRAFKVSRCGFLHDHRRHGAGGGGGGGGGGGVGGCGVPRSASARPCHAARRAPPSSQSHARRPPVSRTPWRQSPRAAVCRSSLSVFIASKMSHAPVRTASSSSRALARVWHMATSEVSIVAPARVVTTAALSAFNSPASKASAERAVCRRWLSPAAGNKADFSVSVLTRLPIDSRASRALACISSASLATLPALREVGMVRPNSAAARLQAALPSRPGRAASARAVPGRPASDRCSACRGPCRARSCGWSARRS
jgi:hypothetical protein